MNLTPARAPVGSDQERNWVDRWKEIADGAQRILAPCPQAEAFAASVLPQARIEKLVPGSERRGQIKRKRHKSPPAISGLCRGGPARRNNGL